MWNEKKNAQENINALPSVQDWVSAPAPQTKKVIKPFSINALLRLFIQNLFEYVPQRILLLFVDFASEFPQASLLRIIQVLQDVFKVLLCIVGQLTPIHSQRNRRISRDKSYQHLVKGQEFTEMFS